MAGQLGLRLGKWLYQKGKVREDQIDIVRYAFEILCSEFTSITTIFLYGIFSGNFFKTILYLVFFHILRQCFHGYHAKTIPRCFTLTLFSYFASMAIHLYMFDKMVVLFLTVSLLLQIEYCYKKRLIYPIVVLSVLYALVVIVCMLMTDWSMLSLLSVVNMIVSVSLIPERRNYYEE